MATSGPPYRLCSFGDTVAYVSKDRILPTNNALIYIFIKDELYIRTTYHKQGKSFTTMSYPTLESTSAIHIALSFRIILLVSNLLSLFKSSALCVCFVDRCLSFCTFSFGHCVVLLRSTVSDYPFSIFKLFTYICMTIDFHDEFLYISGSFSSMFLLE